MRVRWWWKKTGKRYSGANWGAVCAQLATELEGDKAIAWEALILPNEEMAFQHKETCRVFQAELDDILNVAMAENAEENVVKALKEACGARKRTGDEKNGNTAAQESAMPPSAAKSEVAPDPARRCDSVTGATGHSHEYDTERKGREEEGCVPEELAKSDDEGHPEPKERQEGGRAPKEGQRGKVLPVTVKLGIAAAIVLVAFGVGSRALWPPEPPLRDLRSAETPEPAGAINPVGAEVPEPLAAPDPRGSELGQPTPADRPQPEPRRASGPSRRNPIPTARGSAPAREVALSSGSLVVDVVGGGGIAADSLGEGCVGYVRAAPDLRVNWGGRSTDLSVRFVRDEGTAANLDPTLVVAVKQDGSWVCGDDSEDSTDPMVVLQDPRQGDYDVWVGSWDPGAAIPGALHIGEHAGSAFNSLRREAEAGSASAQTELGLAYASSVGVAENHVEALRWLGMAAEQGHEEAVLHLAMIHLAGEGAPQDADRALQWLRRHPQAQSTASSTTSLDQARIAADFRKLESELASSYSEMTRQYLDHWRALDWDTDRPRVAFMGDRSVDDQFARSNQSARDRLREAGDRLRSDLLRADVSIPPALQSQLDMVASAQRQRGVEVSEDTVASLLRRLDQGTDRGLGPSIETAHRDFREKVEGRYDRFQSLIGSVAGRVCALLIDVNPADATVYIDDVPYGTAGEFANEPGRLMPSGTFEVRLERPGYRTHEEVVSTRPYERHFIRGDLTRGDET